MSIPKSSRRQFLQSAAAAASWVAVGGLKARAQSRGPLLVSQGLTPLKFTLSWLPSSMDTPLVTAILKGYFAEEGLEVTYERGYGSADSITKIAAGQYDLGEGDPYSMIEFNAASGLPSTNANRSPVGFFQEQPGIPATKSFGDTSRMRDPIRTQTAPAARNSLPASRISWPAPASQ